MESFEQLASQYEPTIKQIIHSLHIYKNKDEFHQHALIALWEASKKFDPAKGNFSIYAYHYIKGYLLMELTKATVEFERTILPKEEFWDNATADYKDVPLKENILLFYSQDQVLTTNQRKWLMLTVLGSLSIKEIADKENVSISAVKLWRKGASDKLKVVIETHR
ncbi:sigma-70 family RNA polymerase sigma factor [Neobacillus drentensis]|uniref:sigma-70 family RNA polymerase sigma factor n=1 Tax=Neobacillus drentensis TaxID=220684 RepID=UPI002FFE2E24